MSGNFIVDSHCHLNYEAITTNFSEVLQNAEDNNVKLMVSICTKMSEFDNIQKIADAHSNIFMSVGIHPNETHNEQDITFDDILQKTKAKKVVALGETGLDYYYKTSDKDIQIKSFLNHIKVAQQTQLPVVIHSRDADDDMIEILTTEMNKAQFPALLHCFSSGRELAMKAIDLGLYISLSGIITFKNADELRSIVKDIPHNRLLVETDSPYLAPIPHRGKSNQPAYVRYVVEKLAHIIGLSFEDTMRLTTKNFFRLFSKINKKLMQVV